MTFEFGKVKSSSRVFFCFFFENPFKYGINWAFSHTQHEIFEYYLKFSDAIVLISWTIKTSVPTQGFTSLPIYVLSVSNLVLKDSSIFEGNL